jgi:hypothetical protein
VFPEFESVDPAVLDIDVVLNIPSNHAEIRIFGHTIAPSDESGGGTSRLLQDANAKFHGSSDFRDRSPMFVVKGDLR